MFKTNLKSTVLKVNSVTKIYRLFNSNLDRLNCILLGNNNSNQKFYALRDVSLELKIGETLGVFGKNGQGKSTLLKIISGVLMPPSTTAIATSGKSKKAKWGKISRFYF